MNNYCYDFQCSTQDALAPSLDFKAKDVRSIEVCNIKDNILNFNFFEKINSFTPIYIMKIFHTPANRVSRIHEDVDYTGDSVMYAINILLTDDSPGIMEWFYPKTKKSYEVDKHGIPCVNYKLDEVIGISHTTIIKSSPTLIRIDQPHRISTGLTPRACLSIRCRNTFKSWEETIEAYKQAGF